MTSIELKARIEELEAVAEHVPAAVLGKRLLAALEEHVGFEAINLWDRFDDLEEPPDEAAEEGHVGRWVEIPARPEPVEIFDPGIPAGAEDRAAPETPHPSPEDPPEPDDEPSKPCKTCGVPKPLSDFPKNGTYKDGHTNKCKDCTRDYHRRREQASRDRLEEGRNTPEVTRLRPASATSDLNERRCSNGTSCAAVDPDDLVPTPAILDEANPGPLCRRCQKRAGVA